MNKAKKKGEHIGKAITGIGMAAIMLVFLAASVPTVSAEPPGFSLIPGHSYNNLTNNISITWTAAAATTQYIVLIGQDIWLLGANASGAIIQGDPASDYVSGEVFTADTYGKFDTAMMTKSGIYYVNPVISGTTVTRCEAKLAVTNPVMSLDLKSSGTSVSSITVGTNLTADFMTNLGGKDMVSLVITDPDGNIIKQTTNPVQYFDKINVTNLTQWYGTGIPGHGINTTGWKLGTYTFRVETKQNTTGNLGARGLEMSSNEETLTIITEEINISADKTSVAELESVTLTVTGVPGHSIKVNTSDTAHTIFPGGSYDNPSSDCSNFSTIIDSDGKRTYAVYFNDTGSYTITVTDTTAMTTDTVDITVKPPTLEVSIFTDKTVYSPGDVMETSIRIANPYDDTQVLVFKWYLGIPEYDLWDKWAGMPLSLHAGYDQTVTVPIPVGDWGDKSFCGCYIVSLTDMTDGGVVSVDSTLWIYMPGAVSTRKTAVEIAKEIKKGVGEVELPG